MVRSLFALLGLFLVAGCATPAPSPYVTALQEQCAGGSPEACGYLAAAEAGTQQRRIAAAQAFSNGLAQQQANNTALLQTLTTHQQPAAPVNTTCYPIGMYVNCRSY